MSPDRQQNRWIAFRKTTPDARVRLFCLPYAGAGASVFRPWVDLLPPEIELCAIQLPGREERSREERFTRIDPLVEDLARHLEGSLDRPFALFGHSMGSVIAYELACFLRRAGLPEPLHLFVSGRRAPQVPYGRDPVHGLDEEAFIRKLRELNGTPEEVFQHPDLLAYVLPTLRADFAICETYAYRSEAPLRCPISAFGGQGDAEVSEEGLAKWGQLTAGGFRMELFPGGHFFVHECRQRLLATLVDDLRRTTAAAFARAAVINGHG